MKGLERILFKDEISFNPRRLFKKTKKIVEYGIDKIRGYAEKGVNRTREYLETANKYITNTINEVEQGIKKLGNEIGEKVEKAKEVMPYALINTLIFSNRWGQLGYYGATAFVFYQMSQGNSGGWNSKIFPIIVGAISGGLGLIGGILLGDFLFHQSLAYLQHELDSLNATVTKLKDEYDSLNASATYLENAYNSLNATVTRLENEINGLNKSITNLGNEINSLLQNEYNTNNLKQILYGNNNPSDITVIQAKSVTVENGTAYVYGTASSSGTNVLLKIPIGYVENGNVSIQEFFDVVQQYQQDGWNLYIAIDRADLQYMTLLNNQNGTYVISIQPNEPINIGVLASSANSLTLDNVLNHLTQYNIVIQNACPVHNSPFVLKGYNIPNNSKVVIDFQNLDQYEQALTMINIADQIIDSPHNADPTSSGIIYTYSIFRGNMSVYQDGSNYYPEYIIRKTYIPVIVLQSGQGNTIINDVSS